VSLLVAPLQHGTVCAPTRCRARTSADSSVADSCTRGAAAAAYRRRLSVLWRVEGAAARVGEAAEVVVWHVARAGGRWSDRRWQPSWRVIAVSALHGMASHGIASHRTACADLVGQTVNDECSGTPTNARLPSRIRLDRIGSA
jgi:hypothetical protein